jgi:hypothetical protein
VKRVLLNKAAREFEGQMVVKNYDYVYDDYYIK